MSKPLKIALLAGSGLVGLLIFAAAALLLFVDMNAYKHRMEAATADILGLDVSIGGRLGIGFFPGLLVTLEDVHIRNQGSEVAFASTARLEVDFIPLLQNEVRIREISLKRPSVSIERDRDGKYNFEKPDAAAGTLPTLNRVKIFLSDGTLRYADKQSGAKFEAENCNLDVHRLRLSGGQGPDLMKNLSLTAELACGEIRNNGLTVSDLKFSADGKNGVFDLKPVTMQLFGAQGSATIQADFSGAVPLYHVHYSLPQFHIEEFFQTLSPKMVAKGTMDFSANLSMQGKTVNEMTRTADGEVSLRGENLVLNGSDLDEELSRFGSSQNFNLVDVGAFFFAGPVGLAVTKGYNFAGIFQGSGGSSKIRVLVSEWKVERGVAQAQDVAMATDENRIALQGGLDFVNEQFDDVTMALIDAQGCADAQQKIRGSFQKPVVEQPNILKSLTGPVTKLLALGRDLFAGGECEVFYAGSVAPPRRNGPQQGSAQPE